MASSYRKNSEWTNFGLVSVVSVMLMVFDSVTPWLNTPRDVLSVALSPVQTLASVPATIGRFFTNALTAEPDVKIAYENMRDEYFQLKSEALLLRTLKKENDNLRSLLDASKRLDEDIKLAELVNVSIDPYNHRVLISKGIISGVYAGQAVIDDRGVIGQVTEVMPLNSSVMLITDPGHSMPIQVERNGLRTLVEGTGSVSLLRVPFLNQNSDIKEGDILISSGLGGRFPNGYPVAVVSDIDVIEDEAFLRVSAKPIAKLDRSNNVLLLSRGRRGKVISGAASSDSNEGSSNSDGIKQ